MKIFPHACRALIFFVIIVAFPCFEPASAADPGAATDFIKKLAEEEPNWHRGWLLWAAVYYLTGFLVIALPAIAASDVLRDRMRRIVATAAAIMAGVVTWVQPGTRATAHEKAYICLKIARVQLASDEARLKNRYAECASYINYSYDDNTPPK